MTSLTPNKSSPSSLPPNTIVGLYILASCYRLFNAFILQTQFDPDEYWQTLEPAYCLAFSSTSSSRNCAYTWEWTRGIETVSDRDNISSISTSTGFISTFLHFALNGPVRSHVSILPTYCFYKIIKYLSYDTTYMIAHGPVYLNALVVAAPTDVATYCIARWMTTNNNIHGKSIPLLSFIVSLTNWFHGYALVRTYSNSMEAMLLTVGIALLSPELLGGTKKDENSKRHGRKIRMKAKVAFLLGGLGVSIRFTSLAAWIPIGLITSIRSTTNFRDFTSFIFALCALYGGMGLIIGCIIDCWFYGFLEVVPFLGNFHFNVILGNGSLYGTHPSYWYIVAGLPAISGILLPFFMYELKKIMIPEILQKIIWRTRPQGDNVQEEKETCCWYPKATLTTIIVSYVSFHSISSHKEFRFILPILPLVCILSSCTMDRFLTGSTARSAEHGKKILSKRKLFLAILLFLFNYPHLLYLSMIHQRAPVSVNQYISEHIQKLNTMNQNNGVLEQQHTTSSPYSIHYLMGCHSTPLYSHIHVPTNSSHSEVTPIDAWTLDCSPHCRKNSSCESDVFASNPHRFIMQSYYGKDDEEEFISESSIKQCTDSLNDDGTCQMGIHEELRVSQRKVPDLLVIFDNELSLNNVQDMIEKKIGLSEIGRFRHSIKEIEIKDTSKLNNNKAPRIHWNKEGAFQIDGFGRALILSFDHIVLFASKKF